MAEHSKQQREQRRRQREYEAHLVVNDVALDRRRKDVRIAIALAAAAVVVGAATQLPFVLGGHDAPAADPVATSAPTASPDATDAAPTNAANVPSPEIAEHREWTGTMTLNGVALGIAIDGAKAPQAASNFIDLAQKDFYNDVPCHRLTTEGIFVLQCGDPTGTGTGDPGYKFGPLENVPADGVYPAGTIAMARSSDPNSMGSQFFIVYAPTTLPGDGYTVFGQVTSGLDELKSAVIDAGVDASKANSPSDGAPKVPTTITSIDLH